HLVDPPHWNTLLFKKRGSAAGCQNSEIIFIQFFRCRDNMFIVGIPHADEDVAAHWKLHVGTELRLGECRGKSIANSHYFTGGLHLRPQDGIHSRELYEWKYR